MPGAGAGEGGVLNTIGTIFRFHVHVFTLQFSRK